MTSYTKQNVCIWCGRSSKEASFKTRPHTVPRGMRGQNIGVDICDECNHYFGTGDTLVTPHLCIEVCLKEIFVISQLLLSSNRPNAESYKNFKSSYFEYRHSKRVIRFKPAFNLNTLFLKTFFHQFKRGFYEIFLQEYHRCTGNGLDKRFDGIRRFARYNEGDMPIYYIPNNGIYLIDSDAIEHPDLRFSEYALNDIEQYGFYPAYFMGHRFYLAVTPKAYETKDLYLQNEANKLYEMSIVYPQIIELKSITEFDFTLRTLYGDKSR